MILIGAILPYKLRQQFYCLCLCITCMNFSFALNSEVEEEIDFDSEIEFVLQENNQSSNQKEENEPTLTNNKAFEISITNKRIKTARPSKRKIKLYILHCQLVFHECIA